MNSVRKLSMTMLARVVILIMAATVLIGFTMLQLDAFQTIPDDCREYRVSQGFFPVAANDDGMFFVHREMPQMVLFMPFEGIASRPCIHDETPQDRM